MSTMDIDTFYSLPDDAPEVRDAMRHIPAARVGDVTICQSRPALVVKIMWLYPGDTPRSPHCPVPDHMIAVAWLTTRGVRWWAMPVVPAALTV